MQHLVRSASVSSRFLFERAKQSGGRSISEVRYYRNRRPKCVNKGARLTPLLSVLVTDLSIYAWKHWFKSLCGLIVLMEVIANRAMRKNMFGIQGLNLWNKVFLTIFLAWLASRRREDLTWDRPRNVSVLFLLHLGVILVGFARDVLDRSHMSDYPMKNLVTEELVNTIKWVFPRILLFDGRRPVRTVDYGGAGSCEQRPCVCLLAG